MPDFIETMNKITMMCRETRADCANCPIGKKAESLHQMRINDLFCSNEEQCLIFIQTYPSIVSEVVENWEPKYIKNIPIIKDHLMRSIKGIALKAQAKTIYDCVLEKVADEFNMPSDASQFDEELKRAIGYALSNMLLRR